MSLPDFQRAFALVLTDPQAWASRLDDPEVTIGSLQLTERERERLRRILHHPRMSANHLMLQANRMMPLQAALPLTCDWLHDERARVLVAWIADSCDASVQYQRESSRFAEWLPEFLRREGLVPHPALEALRYEVALAELVRRAAQGQPDATLDIDFAVDPDELLDGWRPGASPSACAVSARLRIIDGALVLERRE